MSPCESTSHGAHSMRYPVQPRRTHHGATRPSIRDFDGRRRARHHLPPRCLRVDVRGPRRHRRRRLHHRLAPGTATGLFLFYSALTGVTLSVILIAYTGASIASTFVVTAGMFGALALYGSTTSRSLAGVGQFVFMGLIGLVLASVLAMFWRNAALEFLISVVGVIVFTGLTAWDAQRLRQMATSIPGEKLGSYAIVGALSLYLNFINLFLFMLRFMGGRRD